MNELNSLYIIRDIKSEDYNFILSTFLRGLYYGDSWFSEIDKESFMKNYKPVAEYLIDSTKTVTKVACLKEDENVILGYSVLSLDYQSIHWVYVKNIWRNKGIARQLLPQYPTTITHLTALGRNLLNKFETKPKFNPFKI